MIILGLILLVVGYLFAIPLVEIIGVILLLLGVVFLVLGLAGRPVGGRQWY